MSEVNTAVDQPTQTNDAVAAPEPFAWMDGPQAPEETSVQNPEPTEESQVVEGESSTGEAEGVEDPTQSSTDEWLQSLTPEEHAYYAKRYPTLYNAYQQADQPADLKQAFKDRVNQDRNFEELRAAKEQGEEPTLEEQDADETQQIVQPQNKEEYYKTVEQFVEQNFDKQAITDLGTKMLSAFGVDTSSTDPEVQALVKNAPAVGKVLSNALVDGVSTMLPRILPGMIEQLYPGTAQNFEKQTYASAWEAVRNSDPAYAKLPAYGPPGSDFNKLMQSAAQQIPGFERMQFPGNLQQQAQAKYAILAKIAAGQKVTPAAVAKAVETGKNMQKAQSKSLAAGRAMGAGKSNNAIDDGKGKSNEFSSWIEEFNASQRSTPLK